MRWLYVFAHPDDEVVGSGGLMHKLRRLGHEQKVVLATKGQAGEVHESQAEKLKAMGSIGALREWETRASQQVVGYEHLDFLNYEDGELTNKDTWNSLQLDLIDQIDAYQPDMVVTFDHTGWYYHLDHIAVSIATMRALENATHKIHGHWHVWLRPPNISEKWSYAYPKMAYTHTVDVSDVRDEKVKALEAHASQDINLIPLIRAGTMDEEYFQLVDVSETGETMVGELSNLLLPVG